MNANGDDFKIKVFKDRIFLECENVDKSLLSNLRFKSVVEDSCSNLVNTIDGVLNVEVSKNGKDIVLMSEGKMKDVRGNQSETIALKTIIISLEGDSMVVDDIFGL